MVQLMGAGELPRFLLVGTAKAGTTTIERALAAHPDIGIPRKETFYFDHDRMGGGRLPYPMQRPKDAVIHDEESYRQLYAPLVDKLCVEIGTGYLYHHEVAIPRILRTLGKDVHIGIVLRDPVERTWSSYMHFVKDLHEPLGFEEALAAEPDRIRQDWDFMWHHVAMGRYAEQVRAYMEAFGNVRVFFFEDLKTDQHGFLREVCSFAGADPDALQHADSAHNPSGIAKLRALQLFITTDNPLKKMVRPLWRLAVPEEKRSQARKYVKSRNLSKSEGPTPEEIARLKDVFFNDVRDLGLLLDQDLFAKWKW